MFPKFAAVLGVAKVHDAESVYVRTTISGYQDDITHVSWCVAIGGSFTWGTI